MQRALISVTDKDGILEFARGLQELGVELLSTGGTSRILRDGGLTVKDVSEITDFPEMLDGRVKTIHPRVAGGILAMRNKPEHLASLAEHGIPLIDMVVVNLYAFEKIAAKPNATLDELIEHVDIGGPTLIRAAAKNYQDVAVVTSPGDYHNVLEELRSGKGQLSVTTHWRLAQKAFALTAKYDRLITQRLSSIEFVEGKPVEQPKSVPPTLEIHSSRALDLRYGENPHQQAALYATGSTGVAGARQLQGKELSYNNLVDLDAAWQLVQEFEYPASVIVKHTNPCGCAEQATLSESYRKAFETDPVSAYGGVLAFNRKLDEETAREITKTFIEAIAAPDYDSEALALLMTKKNLRLVQVQPSPKGELVVKSITGGFLAQTPDDIIFHPQDVVVKTKRQPSEEELRALTFTWKVAKHVKSNAIVFGREGQIVGVGAGQMSRLDSVKVASLKAILPLRGTVLASDAFFPFADGVEEAARQGITAVIQPGGSVRDEEVIAAADSWGLAMVFTGVRHFRH